MQDGAKNQAFEKNNGREPSKGRCVQGYSAPEMIPHSFHTRERKGWPLGVAISDSGVAPFAPDSRNTAPSEAGQNHSATWPSAIPRRRLLTGDLTATHPKHYVVTIQKNYSQ